MRISLAVVSGCMVSEKSVSLQSLPATKFARLLYAFVYILNSLPDVY